MRTLEHVLFFFIRGRKFYVWDRTRSHIFFIRGSKFYAWFPFFPFFCAKKKDLKKGFLKYGNAGTPAVPY